jgi:hypothetical protein
MLTTYNEIKKQLTDEWEDVLESRLHEYVEDFTPVYYSAIAKEWQELPMEDTDAWKDYGVSITSETTIYDLMTADLSIYYQGLTERAFREITEEKENAE